MTEIRLLMVFRSSRLLQGENFMTELAGMCTPVCTPFTEYGQAFDEPAFLMQLDAMLDAGMHIIAIAGGTGEFAFLTKDERYRMAELAARHVDGKAQLIIQTSALITDEAIEYSKHAEDVGADVLLVLPPYFEGPDESGVLYHYEKITKSVNVPIMAYNIPVHSGFDVTPALFIKLMEVGNIQYIKDSTGDMLRLEELVAVGARVFNGCDYLNPYALMAGCIGCFSGAGNVMPREFVELYNLCSEKLYQEALQLWDRLKAASRFFWTHPFNTAIKAATNMTERSVGPVRLPVQPLSAEHYEALTKVMAPVLEKQ